MNQRTDQVGISQRLRLEWLQATVNLILAGNDSAAIQDFLSKMLADKLNSNQTVRGAGQKTISILRTIWLNVSPALEDLRDEGLEMLPELNRSHNHAVHWGMTLVAYPFWGAVAAHTGRLLRLQNRAASAQVQRRVREQYGERPTVSRAASGVLRSFMDWGVLAGADARGMYVRGEQHEISDVRVAAWLAEAMLRAQASNAAEPTRLLRHPCLFPYRLPYLAASELVASSRRLEALRQGLDEEALILRSP